MRGDDVKGRLAAAGPKSRTPLAEGLREVRVRALDSYRILPGKCEVLPHMGCLANGCRRIEAVSGIAPPLSQHPSQINARPLPTSSAALPPCLRPSLCHCAASFAAILHYCCPRLRSRSSPSSSVLHCPNCQFSSSQQPQCSPLAAAAPAAPPPAHLTRPTCARLSSRPRVLRKA